MSFLFENDVGEKSLSIKFANLYLRRSSIHEFPVFFARFFATIYFLT